QQREQTAEDQQRGRGEEGGAVRQIGNDRGIDHAQLALDHAHPPVAPVLRHRRQQGGDVFPVLDGEDGIAYPPREEPQQRNDIEPGEPEVAHDPHHMNSVKTPVYPYNRLWEISPLQKKPTSGTSPSRSRMMRSS